MKSVIVPSERRRGVDEIPQRAHDAVRTGHVFSTDAPISGSHLRADGERAGLVLKVRERLLVTGNPTDHFALLFGIQMRRLLDLLLNTTQGLKQLFDVGGELLLVLYGCKAPCNRGCRDLVATNEVTSRLQINVAVDVAEK